MGQVPDFLVLGSGRLARHLLRYLSLLGLPHSTWSRAAFARGEVPTLAEFLRQRGAAPFTHALLAIKDSAIDGFLRDNPGLGALTCVHFSGALSTPSCPSAHPLMAFGDELYTLGMYQRIPFILEADGPAMESLLPGLPNPHFAVPRERKALYHALCVLGGNFTTLLWQKLFHDFKERLGLPPEAALPYLEACLANLKAPDHGVLTGPLARGDQATIAENLKALEHDPFQGVYRAFVSAYEGRPS